ncbi:tail fiber domain-containing protein [Paraliobacillus ryukyuensis]|uniref:tail fiber domain-containing protein n=1 Tax=Paraliobacillus ryukyuensis TaxID=200904 RepID=UPI0009A604A9|nr:tail fiber domain-containing protein [Paraliobacillus ryukyuensis]
MAIESIGGEIQAGPLNRNFSELESQIAKFSDNIDSRVINVKYPPAPLMGAVVDGNTDDTAKIRSIVQFAENRDKGILIPGISVISGEIEIKKSMIVRGIGSGYGYGGGDLATYKQISGFLVKGIGTKRIRTRRKYRGSSSDPQDEPLSVAINVQDDGVKFEDICVFLNFDKNDPSVSNLGDDWDVGIFVGCRTMTLFENVHVVGYWRDASMYFDVTHATNLPRFRDLDGNYYTNENNTSGGDGTNLSKVYTHGGKWGIKVFGALPEEGAETYGNDYYDEELGTAVPDYRGTFGFSDFTTNSCAIYGTDHHSGRRIYKSLGNYQYENDDDAGGVMWIDGLANNSNQSIQGSRHFSTRFASFEAFRIRYGRANRVQLYGCHIESRGANGKLNADGTQITEDQTYNSYTATEYTDNLVFVGATTGFAKDNNCVHPSVRVHNLFPSGTTQGSTTTDRLYADSFGAIEGELDVRSGGSNDPIRFRFGDVTRAYLSLTGIVFESEFTNPSVVAINGELDLRSGDTSFIRMRTGSSTFGLFDATSWRPSTDSVTALGSGSNRFTEVFADTGAINTSDRNAKQQISIINNKVLDAWQEINYSQFKFNDAVEKKGEKARYHFGVIAQEIEEVFKKHGLNAFEYGILCYNEWEDQYEETEELVEQINEDGETTHDYVKTGEKRLIKQAGGKYSIRPDECMMLESALMRRELKRLKDGL